MCEGGPWITGLSLWIKVVFIHRGVYVQLSRPVINGPQARLFTGLNPQKSLRGGHIQMAVMPSLPKARVLLGIEEHEVECRVL